MRLRPRRRVAVPRPDVLADELESLKLRAETGDGSVARAMSSWLTRCNGRNFATDAEFKQFMDKYQQTHTLPISMGNQLVEVMKEPNPQILDELKSDYAFCRGVPDSEIASRDKWLEAAADAGNMDALMQIGRNQVNSEKGLKYLEELWLSGSVDGASWLAKAYAMQSDPEARDYVTAYAACGS